VSGYTEAHNFRAIENGGLSTVGNSGTSPVICPHTYNPRRTGEALIMYRDYDVLGG